MSLGLTTPTPTKQPNHHHHHHQAINPRNPHPIFSKTAKTPSLHCSSSMRTRAAVEEGGFTVERSFYELLGIREESSYDGIKRAYKQLARKYHPDVSPPHRAEEYTKRFIEVHEAYETLSDPCRRAVYDRDLSRGLHLHLAFSTTRRTFHEDVGSKSQWKDCWQYQVEELKEKSMREEDCVENLSWGARMRRQQSESS